MKKKIILTTLVLILMTTLVLSVPAVFAGNKNQNDETNGKSVERGTGKLSNGLPLQSNVPWPTFDIFGKYVEGCRALGGGNVMVYVPGEGDWPGGPCCPSNTYLDPAVSAYPLPNQCCNPPDFLLPLGTLPSVPGNHCICFIYRLS
jgi:hypothetical protein